MKSATSGPCVSRFLGVAFFCGADIEAVRMKSIFLFVAVAAVLGVSCERHEFDGPSGSRQLHERHAAPAHAAGTHEVSDEKKEH